jgi:hypothetical protein
VNGKPGPKRFLPIEREMVALGVPLPRPVEWYVLIRDLEEFRERTGWGLAATWGLVHRRQYEKARAHFDEFVAQWNKDEMEALRNG